MSLLEVDKQLWVGTYGGGISRFDSRTRRFENLRAGPEDGLHLSNGRVTALARDRTGHVWIGTDGGGLNVWDVRTRRLYYYKRDAQATRFAAPRTSIFSILVDDAGGVWIGTRGGGLDRVLNPSRCRRPAALREHLRGAGPAQQHRLWPARGWHRATSGSAPTSAWRGSIPRTTTPSSVFIACTACRARSSTSARTTAIAAASCSSAAPPASTPSIPKCSQFNERPPRVVLTQFLKLNTPGIEGVPEEHIDKRASVAQGRRRHAQVRRARLRRSARQPL